METLKFDVIVVGAGLSGLVAAAAAAGRGARVGLIHGGLGSFVFGAGCVGDLDPADEGSEQDEAVGFFLDLTRRAGCPFLGQAGGRHALPTILGTFQMVSLAPFSLWGGRAQAGARVAVVGIAGLSSFDAHFTADRLNREVVLDCHYQPQQITLSHEMGVAHSTLNLANRFDRDPAFRAELDAALRPILPEIDQILLPAILGQQSGLAELSSFAGNLGRDIGELPTLPPSVAGLRLSNRLLDHLRHMGVEVMGGHPVIRLELAGGRCRGVTVENPGRPRLVTAGAVVLASGPQSSDLLPGWGGGVDDCLRPLSAAGGTLADNLYAAGALLPVSGRRCGNGRALVTGYLAGVRAVRQEAYHAAH